MTTPPHTGRDGAAYSPGGVTERLSVALADRYRIERPLGQGGMATVYLASDLKHDRKVALKVLKPELSAVLGADRFVVEIKTTAALQHPHILPLFDSGSAEGHLYYVMPYVEGETLRQKLNRETQFGVDEAVRIARDVADALDYAHRHGVVHRDIKPENILLHDGRPVVADFGIALAVSAAAGGRMTETGLSLGTPHYMSPEQATADKDITPRSDIYSVGSVLYEMLTGNPPHTGSSAQQIIMKIITDEAAPVTKFRKSVPPHVAAAVAKSLEKVPADRFDTARAFAEALTDPTFTTATGYQAGGAAAATSPLRSRAFLAAASVAVVATVGALWGWMRPEPPREVSRFSLQLPDSQAMSGGIPGHRVAISPDGRTLAYVGDAASQGRIWVRRMDQLRATPLPGTERAANPAFSPDGRKIAFVTIAPPRALRTVAVSGGGVLTLTDSLVDAGGVTWSDDGYIYYDAHLAGDGLARIRETGGTPEVASRPDSSAGELYHLVPDALPGGRGVLIGIARSGGAPAWDVGVLDTRTGRHTVLARGVAGKYSPTGHLVYATAEGMLMAAPFDLGALRMTGEAVLLADGVAVRGNSRVDLGISGTGMLAYVSGFATGAQRELVWVDRGGRETPADPSWSQEIVGRPALSPDGRRAAVTVGRGSTRQVWVKELDRGPATRVTDVGWDPSWSPDGHHLIVASPTGVLRVPADGSTLPLPLSAGGRPLLGGGAGHPSYSPDGRWVLYLERGDVHAVRVDGDTSQRVAIVDVHNQARPALSPDGRWVAYASDESGTWQVYVRPFPNTGTAKRQISLASGWAPRWSRTGRELFYLDMNLVLWSVAVGGGAGFTSGVPQELFSALAYGPGGTYPFEVSADGSRFLFTRSSRGAQPRPDELVIVQNFAEELKTRR